MGMRDKGCRMERLFYDAFKVTCCIESTQMKVQNNNVAIDKQPETVEFSMRKRESQLKKKTMSTSQQLGENKVILKNKRQFLVI